MLVHSNIMYFLTWSLRIARKYDLIIYLQCLLCLRLIPVGINVICWVWNFVLGCIETIVACLLKLNWTDKLLIVISFKYYTTGYTVSSLQMAYFLKGNVCSLSSIRYIFRISRIATYSTPYILYSVVVDSCFTVTVVQSCPVIVGYDDYTAAALGSHLLHSLFSPPTTSFAINHWL